MRLQNCTFDSANVLEGPPENTAPIVTTYKKLCRTQAITLIDVGLLQVQTENSQVGGSTTQVSPHPETEGREPPRG